ncbi:MAG: PilZ domain-containing protein [Desulfobacterales bacterium]|nr:PilZ domain-containing protein [Desulfobacterales bacterium]
MEEKRKYPRINKRLKFEVKNHDDFVVIAETINLSASGAYCMVNKPVSLMTSLRIVLPLIYGNKKREVEYAECNGVVVRVEEVSREACLYNIAIFFSEIDESERQKIVDYIKIFQNSGKI